MSISLSAELAVAFATIERPSVVQRLIRSIRARFPTMPIYVADQSRRLDLMAGFYETYGVQIVRMPFDSGVAASRNRLVEMISQEFFVLCDDDFIFRPETSFKDALRVLRERPDVGVVGGSLIDTSEPPHCVRHWEMWLEKDRSRRLLTSIPIFHFAPKMERVEDVAFHPCDAVMNFALFRRALFTNGIGWDERFTCNGEHEDFYLNLKLRSQMQVVYLPSMLAEHNHPNNLPQYQNRLRDRAEGWRLFMEKWEIDQYLELGVGVRVREDPGVLLTATQAKAAYPLPTDPPATDLQQQPTAAVAVDDRDVDRFRMFFRHDPWLRPDADFFLWHRCEHSTETSADQSSSVPAFLRWFGPDGATLVWEADELLLELNPAYWRPAPITPPLMPRGASWMRFEVAARAESGAAPLATGFVFADTGAPAQPFDVLALSYSRSPLASEAPDSPAISGAGAVTGSERLKLVPIEGAEAQWLVFPNSTELFGSNRLTAQTPRRDLDAPKVLGLPSGPWLDGAAILRADHDGHIATVAQLASARRNSGSHTRHGVTAVLTSCGRPELLERTLTSFFAFNTCALERLIVIEDGPRDTNLALMRRFADRPIVWIGTERRAGQIEAIDLAYSMVDTDFIFHLEDDWEFYAPGFIEKSLAVLDEDPACLQVWLRALDDTNDHPLLPAAEIVRGIAIRRLAFDHLGQWHGFSLNPGLRRTADYHRIGPYSLHVRFDPGDRGSSEAGLSQLYRRLGMYAAILADNDGKGYVRHIGWGRTVPAP